MGSPIARNEAVSHHQLASPVVGTVPDAPSTVGGGIAVNGAKGYRRLGGATHSGGPTTGTSCCIGRDRAVDERECPLIVDASSIMGGTIAGDGAADERERPLIVDAPSVIHLGIYRPIVRNDAVSQRELPNIVNVARLKRQVGNDGGRAS